MYDQNYKNVVRQLAEWRIGPSDLRTTALYGDVETAVGIGREECRRILHLLHESGFIWLNPYAVDMFKINSSIVAHSEAINPTRNILEEWTSWIYSSPWRAYPVMIVGAIVFIMGIAAMFFDFTIWDFKSYLQGGAAKAPALIPVDQPKEPNP